MEASQEIRAVIAGWFDAVVAGDVGWRDRHVSKAAGLRIIGTDPAEWLEGQPAFAFLRDEAAAVGGKVTVALQSLEGFAEGSVGWGAAVPEITLADGRKVAPRWSAVFHRENGAWKLVQLHASVAVGNEAAFGDTFTATAATGGP
jgi:ketosteroid isomerase-like protein